MVLLSRIFSRTYCTYVEKMKCLFHYFNTVIDAIPQGSVIISRESRATFPDWEHSSQPVGELEAFEEGTIESGGVGMAQVDFANRFIGGGVLRGGCLQEEIRFITCPETLISCLVCERMQYNEAIVIRGALTYSNHEGYRDKFK